MLPRRRLWILLAVVGLAVGLNAWASEPLGSYRATFERIHIGMTREEVAATVGGPPGDYSDGKAFWPPDGLRVITHEGWLGPDAGLKVRFDANGRADDVKIVAVMPTPQPTLWQQVRRRLGF